MPSSTLRPMPPQAEYLQFGGQAVVEGVMMRSPTHFAVACLSPTGEIKVQAEEIEKTWVGKQKWLKKPFLRGSLGLIDSMALGYRAMRFAADIAMEEEAKIASAADGEPEKAKETEVEGTVKGKRIQDGVIGATLVFSLALGLFLFVYLPNVISEMTLGSGNGTLKNIVSEIVKITFFFGYMWLISLNEGIRRVFQFHGAEHKAINTFEAGEELTVDNCRPMTRLHPRCGTSFAIVVLILGLLVFPFIPRYPFAALQNFKLAATGVRFVMEVVILPIIAGIAYEAIRLAGKFKNQKFVQFVFWPGLMTQYLTTKEPDDQQIEVALAALRAVVPDEIAAREKVEGKSLQVASEPA